MSEITLTKQNFDQEVLQSDRPVLIDFWASWCMPCKMLSPVVHKLAEEHPEIKVCKVNVDEERELAMKFRVSSIPALFVVKDGRITNTAVGYRSLNDVVALVNQ